MTGPSAERIDALREQERVDAAAYHGPWLSEAQLDALVGLAVGIITAALEPPPAPRRPPRPETPALVAWRRRLLRSGEDSEKPQTWRLDALWRAASAEQKAIEAWEDGLGAEAIEEWLRRAERALQGRAA